MNNVQEKRCDKMFSLKLCTNIEIGGWNIDKDMWYDPQKDEPYYIEKNGQRNYDISNMLHIDQEGILFYWQQALMVSMYMILILRNIIEKCS